jgi:hypothetical protein
MKARGAGSILGHSAMQQYKILPSPLTLLIPDDFKTMCKASLLEAAKDKIRQVSKKKHQEL